MSIWARQIQSDIMADVGQRLSNLLPRSAGIWFEVYAKVCGSMPHTLARAERCSKRVLCWKHMTMQALAGHASRSYIGANIMDDEKRGKLGMEWETLVG